MRIFHSHRHKLRDAATELHGGQLVRPFEAPFRVDLILEALHDQGFGRVEEPEMATSAMAASVHDEAYLDFLATAWNSWRKLGFQGEAIGVCFPARRMRKNRPPRDVEGALGYYGFTADTSITEGTFEAAIASMSCALSAAKAVRDGTGSAFALCRPPGHHASKDQYGGYCFLNNAAVAAQTLIEGGLDRVAIVDIDFHHGNGTQDIFYERSDVLFISIHGDPLDAFPHFLGFADEKGGGSR